VHIIGLGLASLIKLVSLNEWSRKWIVLLELEVSRSFIVAKSRSNGKVLWTSIENYSSWLRMWRAHINSTHINCVVSASERNLQVDITGVILWGICLFTHKLLFMDFCGSINSCINLDLGLSINIKVLSLLEKGALFLLKLIKGLANVRILHVSKLSVAHVFDHNLSIMHVRFLQFLNFNMRDEVLLQFDS